MSSVYLYRFGLKEDPFRLTPDPRYFYRGEQYDRVLAELRYGIEQKKGFMVLTGEVGTGKTTVCRTLLDMLDPSIRTALILNPSLTPEELLKTIVQDFGLPMPSLFPTKKELLDTLNRFLLEVALKGEGAVLIVDEAQNLTRDLLEELRLLTNLETEQEKLLQIILIGQPELSDKLALRELRQLRQRVAVWTSISSLGLEETGKYIARRLQVASEGSPGIRFNGGAVRRIHDIGGGYPRTVNLLCDRAIMLAYSVESDVVTGRMISNAAREVVQKEIPEFHYHRKSVAAAGVVALFLALLPSGIGNFEKLVPDSGSSAEERVLVTDPKTQVPEVLSRYLTMQGYGYIGKEVLQWRISGKQVSDIDIALKALDINRQYGIRTAIVPPHHSLWLKSGSAGIVQTPEGSFAVVEPLWGENGSWKIVDRTERELAGPETPAWDGALVLYRPLNGLEIPLDKGDRGTSVFALQAALSRLGVLKRSEIDGIYGSYTTKAIESLQKQWHLEATGALNEGTAYYLTKFLEIRN